MSDAKNAEPDDDFLEFLGGIDEANEDSKEGDFSDFLARADIEKVVGKPKPPGKDAKSE